MPSPCRLCITQDAGHPAHVLPVSTNRFPAVKTLLPFVSSPTCRAGFVLVKKVPGTLHFTPRSEHHSFDHNWMNMTHTVNGFYFGALPSPTKFHALKKLHPLGLNSDW